MWSLAVTAASSELLVRDELVSQGLAVFCPYTREKVRVKLPTRGRTVFKATWQDVVRWPRYVFVQTTDIALILAVRAVRYIVKAAEGTPAVLTNEAMEKLRAGHDASGRVITRGELHDFSVGDMLRFVAGSSFAGHSGEVLRIDDSGAVAVLVDGHTKLTVDFKELAA